MVVILNFTAKALCLHKVRKEIPTDITPESGISNYQFDLTQDRHVQSYVNREPFTGITLSH